MLPRGTDPSPSPAGCVRVAKPGQTNLIYGLVVDNLLTDRPVPWPEIQAAVNLNEAGTATAPPGQYGIYPFHGVEIAPNASDTVCFLASFLSGSRFRPEMISAGSSDRFMITAGPITDPPPAGTALVVKLPDGQTVSIPVG